MNSLSGDLECSAALLLLALGLFGVPRAYARAWRIWSGDHRARYGLGAASVLAALTRLVIAPHAIVTMYIGYLLTAQSIELSLASHYGVASQALYHVLFAFLPHDHRVLLWTNSVLGLLALPLAATFAARALDDRRIGIAFGLIIAIVPLFVRNDNSDANNVPCLLWLWAGLVLWEEFLDAGSREAMFASLALFALAAVSRPEMPVLVPLTVVALTAGMGKLRSVLRDRVFLAAAFVTGLLVVPHALHVVRAVADLDARDSLPGVGRARLGLLGPWLLTRNTVLDPSLFPIALLPLAVFGLADPRKPRGRIRLAIALIAFVSIAIYGVDLCRANMARVHVLGALWVALLAGAGAVRSWDLLARPWQRALLVAVVFATAVPTAKVLFAPTNEQAEEDFLRDAIAALPAGRFTLVRIAREDRDRAAPGAAFTHFHFPDYLLRPPQRSGDVASIGDFAGEPDFTAPAYFYLGMRCYAQFRDTGTPPPHGDALQPACARMREQFRLDPVVERAVPNRGDVWLEYYGDAPILRLGLYRITPR